jgi:transcriptional regulator with XRE-family HTH domain
MTNRKANEAQKLIGARVRLARHARNMSQSDLGLCLGVTFQQIQKYENGSNRFSAGTLLEIAGIVEMPLAFFFEDFPAIMGLQGSNSIKQTLDGFMSDPIAYRLAQAFEVMTPRSRKACVALIEEVAALQMPATKQAAE